MRRRQRQVLGDGWPQASDRPDLKTNNKQTNRWMMSENSTQGCPMASTHMNMNMKTLTQRNTRKIAPINVLGRLCSQRPQKTRHALVAVKNFQAHRDMSYMFTHSAWLTWKDPGGGKMPHCPSFCPPLPPVQLFPITGIPGLELTAERLIDSHVYPMVRLLCFEDRQPWKALSLLVKGKAATAILRLTVLHPGQLTADGNRGFTEGLTQMQYSISCCFSPLENRQNGVVTHNPMFYILLLFWAGSLLLRVTVKLVLVATVHLMLDFIKPDSTTGSSFSPGMQMDTESLACSSLVKWEYRSSHTTFKSFGSIGWLYTEYVFRKKHA